MNSSLLPPISSSSSSSSSSSTILNDDINNILPNILSSPSSSSSSSSPLHENNDGDDTTNPKKRQRTKKLTPYVFPEGCSPCSLTREERKELSAKQFAIKRQIIWENKKTNLYVSILDDDKIFSGMICIGLPRIAVITFTNIIHGAVEVFGLDYGYTSAYFAPLLNPTSAKLRGWESFTKEDWENEPNEFKKKDMERIVNWVEEEDLEKFFSALESTDYIFKEYYDPNKFNKKISNLGPVRSSTHFLQNFY